jgi:hypothetical protein
MRRLIPAIGMALAIGVAGCAGPAASVLPSPSAAVPPSLSSGAECDPIDLRDPSGTRIVLTGTWREPGGGPVYYVYQDRDCLWYVGGFAASDGEQVWGPLGLFTITFQGRVAADFTIVGQWAVVRTAGNSFEGNDWHEKTWTLEFEPSDSGYDVVLTSPPDENPAFTATRLVKVSDDVVTP